MASTSYPRARLPEPDQPAQPRTRQECIDAAGQTLALIREQIADAEARRASAIDSAEVVDADK